MYSILVTLPTFHPERPWLKAEAPSNMLSMVATLPTFHPERPWLKAEALRNMFSMVVTLPTLGPASPTAREENIELCSTLYQIHIYQASKRAEFNFSRRNVT